MASTRFAAIILVLGILFLMVSFAFAHHEAAGIAEVSGNIAGRKALMKGRKMDCRLLKEESDASAKKTSKDSPLMEAQEEISSKSFADAADEIVKVMNRDYNAKDHPIPKRKPPVNNHDPTN